MKKYINNKIVVIIAGVLIVIAVTTSVGHNMVFSQVNKYNNNEIVTIMNEQAEQYNKGNITVVFKDNTENYIKKGTIKVHSNLTGEKIMKAKNIGSNSKGDVLCQYVIKYHTYDYREGFEDKSRTIQDLGVWLPNDENNEFILPIPENMNVDNNELGVIVYIALQEIDGNGFEFIESINIPPDLLNKPDSLKTNGRIYGDDGSGYDSIENYIKYAEQIKSLTPEEQDYRNYEITKYTTSNSLIDLETNEIVISKAVELRESSDSNEEFIDKVYKLIRSMEYDQELFDKNKETGRLYIPDINSKFEESKGICVDKSWMVALMLRSQGIPTKIVDGYQEFIGAHSWNEVLINGQWVHIDATNGHLYGMVNGYEPLRVQ